LPWYKQTRSKVAIGILTLGGGYYVSHLETVPVSGRVRFMAMSEEAELKIGEDHYRELMAQYRGKMLPQYHRDVQRVRNVGLRLVHSAKLDVLPWEFHVVQDPSPNAFVIPGGKVFVHTGMLQIMQDDDGIAAVLGHEIAHQLARHVAEGLSYGVLFSLIRLATMMVLDLGSLNDLFFKMILSLPHSRRHENEADYIGLLLMAEACFDPRAAEKVWQRMAAAGQSGGIEFLSTHPSTKNRITNMQAWIPEAQKRREQNCDVHLEAFQRWIQ